MRPCSTEIVFHVTPEKMSVPPKSSAVFILTGLSTSQVRPFGHIYHMFTICMYCFLVIITKGFEARYHPRRLIVFTKYTWDVYHSGHSHKLT